MSKFKLALMSLAVLWCANAAATNSFAQAAAPAQAPARADIRVSTSLGSVDSTVSGDAALDKMLEVYSPKVHALNQVIGKLKGDLRKGGVGSGSLGNFVADGMRSQASAKLGRPIILAVTNGGGLRKNTIAEGDLRLIDIFELLPFENSLYSFDLTGAQTLELLRVVLTRQDAQSGARIRYKLDPAKKLEMESARFLIDGVEQEINPAATYTVISIDYLLNVTGGDYAAVLKQAKNIKELGVTTRDAITNYVKAETAAGRIIKSTFDGRFVFNRPGPAPEEEAKP